MNRIFKVVCSLYVLRLIWVSSRFPVAGAVGAVVDPKCNNSCICCINERCHTGFGWPNACSEGCIDRHRGARCYELCTHNCVSCTDHEDICTSCFEGFHPGPDKDCTSECPTNCKVCTSDTMCTVCKDGYYDKEGSTTCPYAFCPQNCKCSGNTCSNCKNGFYDTGNECSKECPSNCMSCSSREICNECKHGFYNVRQLSSNCTFRCRGSCSECHSYDNCLQCIKGRYGQKCQHNCSIGCKDQTCDIESGYCSCSSNFDGDKCTDCVNGKYGTYCNETCSEYCKNGVCNKTSGYCSEGCTTNTITGETCKTCVVGMYGIFCGKNCSTNCKAKTCNRTTGFCSGGCEGNFKGPLCDTCIQGKYGVACDQNCSLKCENALCEKETGKCVSCTGNFDGVNCENCQPGFHGQNCYDSCSTHCYNTTCGIGTGVCDYGCTNNYSGDMCCVPSGNCVKCASKLECRECKLDYFGYLCDKSCPVNCLDSCNISTGVCRDCIINHFGPFCNRTCSENCNALRSGDTRHCASVDGRCTFGCKDGFYGITCNDTCSDLCIGNICKQDGGICEKGCGGSSDDPVCVRDLGQTSTTSASTSIVPIAGGVSGAALAVIIGIVFAIFFVKRRRTGKPSEQQNGSARTEHAREGPVYENYRETQLLEDDEERNSYATRKDSSTAVDVGEVEIDERSKDAASRPSETYYNFGPNSHRVKVNVLFSYVTEHVDSFANEFGNLAKDLDLTQHCTFAKKPENLPLNRYNGIYPYDHSRVTISDQPGFFINACYIDGYNNRKKAYIASLGPTAKTTDKFSNFWLMVWNEKSDIIVMLTNLREASGMKCEKYWPELEKGQIYGQIKVTCRSIEDFAEYTVRTFSISKGKAERHVVQLHYTAWPDKGVPQEVTSLVEFRQRVKAVPLILGGPVIVHCSAGVGRTGTYIALDQLTEEGKCEGSVDVFNCVNRMREQRVNMVQTADQYKFLYKSLVHSLSFGCEALTAEEIQGFTYKADGHLFTDMFETLRQEVDIESKEDTEDRQENRRRHKDKNRRHSDIPAHRSRVRLYLARADGHHDYINAVFINSFRTKNLFIAAQSPLPGTVEDFVCMIYQQNSSCVVDLEESHDQNDVGKYLPADNETYKCGDFTVTSSKCETKKQYILKKVSIKTTKKSEEKSVYHFKYTKWGRSKTVPDSVEDFVHFVKDVEKIVNRQTEDQPHIVAHCLSGYERTGLFCVVYKLLEKLEAERQVSVVNTVRKIRTHRKQSITSVEQLKFCYQCISAYLEMYNTYSNFAT